jgi:hypothetical protein
MKANRLLSAKKKSRFVPPLLNPVAVLHSANAATKSQKPYRPE